MKYFVLPNDISFEDLAYEYTGKKVIHPPYLKYIVSYLITSWVYEYGPKSRRKKNKDLESDHVPIHAESLKKLIPEYKAHLTVLEEAGIIEKVGNYSAGNRSNLFRVKKLFKEVTIEQITEPRFLRKLKTKKGLEVPHHISKWFEDGKLSIDVDQAHGINEQFRHKPKLFFLNSISIQLIANGVFNVKRDAKVLRVNSIITSLKSELRPALRYDGKELITLDIKTSQPFLLASTILNSDFYSFRSLFIPSRSLILDHPMRTFLIGMLLSMIHLFLQDQYIPVNTPFLSYMITLPYISLSSLYFTLKNYWRISSHSPTPLMEEDTPYAAGNAPYYVAESPNYVAEKMQHNKRDVFEKIGKEVEESLDQPDVQMFRKIIYEDDIYDYLKREIPKIKNRGEAKDALFEAIYSDHRRTGSKVKKALRSKFPNVMKILNVFKEQSILFDWHNEKKPYASLSVMLQSIESMLMIDSICKGVSDDHPEIPIFTIHDSILTTEENEEKVRLIIEGATKSLIGFKPQIRRD